MTDADKIDFLAGRIHGLLAAVLAVVKSHPDPGELARQFEIAAQVGLAKTEATSMSDTFLDSFLDVRNVIQRAIYDRTTRPPGN